MCASLAPLRSRSGSFPAGFLLFCATGEEFVLALARGRCPVRHTSAMWVARCGKTGHPGAGDRGAGQPRFRDWPVPYRRLMMTLIFMITVTTMRGRRLRWVLIAFSSCSAGRAYSRPALPFLRRTNEQSVPASARGWGPPGRARTFPPTISTHPSHDPWRFPAAIAKLTRISRFPRPRRPPKRGRTLVGLSQ